MNTEINLSKSTPLSDVLKLAPSCGCVACSHGCTMGSGCFADGETKKLAQFMGITEDELEKHIESVELFNKKMVRPKIERKSTEKPYGKCTFYDSNKGCTVHPAKPLQCKISMGCKPYSAQLTSWFTLNHILNVNDPEAIRQYASFIENGGNVIDGGKLEQLVPDETMRKKMLNYEVLK